MSDNNQPDILLIMSTVLFITFALGIGSNQGNAGTSDTEIIP